MVNGHQCVSAFCALCGVPSCVDASTYPLRLQEQVGWTHQTVYPASLPLGFALHEACWEIFVQQYHRLAGANRLPNWQLVLLIHANLRPSGQGSPRMSQLPFFPTWCDRYTDSARGRGPQDAWFPDGYAEDLWESTGLNANSTELMEMDFLLISPLDTMKSRRNFERVRFCSLRLARLVVQQSDQTLTLRRKIAPRPMPRPSSMPVAMSMAKL